MSASPHDPYAPPASPLETPLDPRLQPRYVWAQRALLAVLLSLAALMAVASGARLRAGVPWVPVLLSSAYQIGLPAVAFHLVRRRRHVGYLLSLTVGSMFVSLVGPVLQVQPLTGSFVLAASVALWALSWYVARGWFGYLFKRPLHLARPSTRPIARRP